MTEEEFAQAARQIVENAVNDVMSGARATVYSIGPQGPAILRAAHAYAKELYEIEPTAGWTVHFDEDFRRLRFEQAE